MNSMREIMCECENAAIQMRMNVLKLAHLAGSKGAHLGGCLSIIEIMPLVYCHLKVQRLFHQHSPIKDFESFQ